MPDIPTLDEQGLKGFEVGIWHGLYAPKNTPKPVVDKLYAAVSAVLGRPDQREGLARQMMSVELSKSPTEFTELVRKETQDWGEFLRGTRIKLD